MTANTLTALMGKVLARGLTVLRKKCVMPQLVNSDFSADFVKKGTTVDVPIPSSATAGPVTPSNTPPVPGARTAATFPLKCDTWNHSDFFLTDKDKKEIDAPGLFLPQAAEASVIALSDLVNADILANYKYIYGAVGTAGTTPFGSTPKDTDAINCRKLLNKQKCPDGPRAGMLDPDAEANALNLDAFKLASNSADTAVMREGRIGIKFGIDWNWDDTVPTHTRATVAAGNLTVDGAHVANRGSVDFGRTGTIDLNKATNPVTLEVGDLFTIAGHTQYFTVIEQVELAAGVKTAAKISPALPFALSGSEVVTIIASHVVNLVFHRDCLAFVNRSLMDTDENLATLMSMQDPVSRLVMRLEVSRQYKQTVWDYDILYGSGMVRPEFGVRLLG